MHCLIRNLTSGFILVRGLTCSPKHDKYIYVLLHTLIMINLSISYQHMLLYSIPCKTIEYVIGVPNLQGVLLPSMFSIQQLSLFSDLFLLIFLLDSFTCVISMSMYSCHQQIWSTIYEPFHLIIHFANHWDERISDLWKHVQSWI